MALTVLPENVGLKTSLQYVDRPTNTFIIDQSSGQISGMDNGLRAMRQAVDIILNTERYQWQIYDSNFGSELQDLPGEEYDYIVGDIPRRIEEAFSMDNRILSVENFLFADNGSGSMTITFDVVTVFGIIQEEVTT